MKKIILLLFCTISSLSYCVIPDAVTSVITYRLNGGRFGDNLLSYSKAKWLSLKYDIPLLYIPFPYSDQLKLHENERKYTKDIAQQYAKEVIIPRNKHVTLDSHARCIYINQWYSQTDIRWNDQEFLQEIKKNIAPLYEIERIKIPEDCISVAVHIRTGGGFVHDDAAAFRRYPLRFVSISFYIDQVRQIIEMHRDKRIYVHIFTDHQNPKLIAQQFQNIVRNQHVLFGYRAEKNHRNANVLEDFFSMMDFDYLIRPGSHYSRFVERLGNNKVVIFPSHVTMLENKEYIIDQVTIKTKVDNKWHKQVIAYVPQTCF